MEAWHRSFNFKCNVPHLNFGKFLEILIQENEKVRVTLIQAKHDISVNSNIIEKNEKLRVIVDNFTFYDEETFFTNLNKVMWWKLD